MQFYQGKRENLVGAKHYRDHPCISPQSSNGNASPKPPAVTDNLQTAKRVKHLRTEISVKSLDIVAQMLDPYRLLVLLMRSQSNHP
jgi:hypothetical protein